MPPINVVATPLGGCGTNAYTNNYHSGSNAGNIYGGGSYGLEPENVHLLYKEHARCESTEYISGCIKQLYDDISNVAQNEIKNILRDYARIDGVLTAWSCSCQREPRVFDAIQAVVGSPGDSHLDQPFSGRTTMPMAALYHFLAGGGAPRSLPIQNLGLKTAHVSDIKPLFDKLLDPSTPNGCTIAISETYTRNTEHDNLISRWTVGEITLLVEGTLSIDAGGYYRFVGELRAAIPDTYDGGKKSEHRNNVDNQLTSILSALQKMGATPYKINFPGSIPLRLEGQRP
jgi:hypothetical protein